MNIDLKQRIYGLLTELTEEKPAINAKMIRKNAKEIVSEMDLSESEEIVAIQDGFSLDPKDFQELTEKTGLDQMEIAKDLKQREMAEQIGISIIKHKWCDYREVETSDGSIAYTYKVKVLIPKINLDEFKK